MVIKINYATSTERVGDCVKTINPRISHGDGAATFVGICRKNETSVTVSTVYKGLLLRLDAFSKNGELKASDS